MDEERWLTFENGKWKASPPGPRMEGAGFAEIGAYYPNLIGYLRIVMCLLAAVTIGLRQPLLTALLIIGSTLLDWIDGPVARAYGQCSIFGSGVDWLADILGQFVLVLWWAWLAPAMLPILVVASAIELTNCIFDFATTATGRYPVLTRQSGFRIILQWCMPGGSYTTLGTFLWLAYPLFGVVCCLDYSWPVRSDLTSAFLHWSEVGLVVPAILYLWCELAYVMFIIEKWREAPRSAVRHPYDDSPAGVALLGMVSEAGQALLEKALNSSRVTLRADWNASCDKREIFWINLWQRTGNLKVVEYEGLHELDEWARGLADQAYPGQKVVCDGYGFIINPMESKAQPWHVDYTMDYSTIFIPLTRLTPENTLQYAVLPANAPESTRAKLALNLDVVDLHSLVDECEYVSVRQLLARPFSLIKMDFGTIHRGVSNQSGFERIMFWISFSRSIELLPVEPSVAIIK